MVFWMAVALLAATVWHLLGKRFLSLDAFERRRRGRSYGRVSSRRRRPTVRLAVRVPST